MMHASSVWCAQPDSSALRLQALGFLKGLGTSEVPQRWPEVAEMTSFISSLSPMAGFFIIQKTLKVGDLQHPSSGLG